MIDFHCHLDLYEEARAIAQGCIDRNMYVLSVTTTPTAWSGTTALAAGSSRVKTALGLHPQLARQRKAELAVFDRVLPDTRYVGEVGLDGSPARTPDWEDQIFVFGWILDACRSAGGRVLSVHSRRAAAPVLDMLEARPGAGSAVLHWFSGSHGELARAVAMGCWFSVGPAMLESAKGRALVARMPRDRVLTESDGPFARVGRRGVLPWDVAGVTAGLAAMWGTTQCGVDGILLANLRRLVSSL